MKEFYENLKSKREEKGLSLEDIHRKTHLPIHYLEAIEAGNIEALPHGYERIYLRRYARELGLDPDEVVRDFDLLSGRLTAPETTPAKSKPVTSQPKPKPRKRAESRFSLSDFFNQLSGMLPTTTAYRIFWISLVGIILVAAGYITYQQYMFEKNTRPVKVKEITISDLIENYQQQDSALTPKLEENTVVESQQPPQVFVNLKAVQRTWIREIRDKKDTTEYIMTPGLTREIKAVESVQFLLGRADGVLIWLNGDSLGLMGEANQVVTNLLLGKEGIITRRLKTVEPKPAPPDTSAADTTETMVSTTETTLDSLDQENLRD